MDLPCELLSQFLQSTGNAPSSPIQLNESDIDKLDELTRNLLHFIQTKSSIQNPIHLDKQHHDIDNLLRKLISTPETFSTEQINQEISTLLTAPNEPKAAPENETFESYISTIQASPSTNHQFKSKNSERSQIFQTYDRKNPLREGDTWHHDNDRGFEYKVLSGLEYQDEFGVTVPPPPTAEQPNAAVDDDELFSARPPSPTFGAPTATPPPAPM